MTEPSTPQTVSSQNPSSQTLSSQPLSSQRSAPQDAGLPATPEILERLIAFDTTSRNPNRELMAYVSALLESVGVASTLIPDETGGKANLYATIGPRDRGGVMLSGHTDVVPVDGQAWTKPPFQLTVDGGRYYGRGTTDMKGFVASALATALRAAGRPLKTPLHLALSYDEEIGCVGVRSMIDMLAAAPIQPRMCLVGEPTNLQVATGHKGKTDLFARCRGREGHSALAPEAMNALHLGADLIGALRAEQASIKASGRRDGDYDVPYTTVHVGVMSGGVALNIVPNLCELRFEIRAIAEDDPMEILGRIKAAAADISAAAQERAPEAGIEIEVSGAYPGLLTAPDADVVAFVKTLAGRNGTIKVAYGTEGGFFQQRLGVPTVICGPGSMAQGHKPDEFVEIAEIERCDAMLAALLDRLDAGI